MNRDEIIEKLISKVIVHYFHNVPLKFCIATAYEELSDDEKLIIDEKINKYKGKINEN